MENVVTRRLSKTVWPGTSLSHLSQLINSNFTGETNVNENDISNSVVHRVHRVTIAEDDLGPSTVEALFSLLTDDGLLFHREMQLSQGHFASRGLLFFALEDQLRSLYNSAINTLRYRNLIAPWPSHSHDTAQPQINPN